MQFQGLPLFFLSMNVDASDKYFEVNFVKVGQVKVLNDSHFPMT